MQFAIFYAQAQVEHQRVVEMQYSAGDAIAWNATWKISQFMLNEHNIHTKQQHINLHNIS